MTLQEIATRKHHAFVARELLWQARGCYTEAELAMQRVDYPAALRHVLDGDIKMARAVDNLKEAGVPECQS